MSDRKRGAESVSIGEEDHRGVAMPIAVCLGDIDQDLDFVISQIWERHTSSRKRFQK